MVAHPPIKIPIVNMYTQDHYADSARQGSIYDEEDPWNAYFMLPQMAPDVGVLPDPAVERLHTMEEKFKAMKFHNTSGIDVVDMCLE